MLLLTGGCGYIGSHCAVALIRAGYKVVLVDNFSNSHRQVLDGIRREVGDEQYQQDLEFYQVDLCTEVIKLRAIFELHPISAVIHLAAYKSVPESVAEPLKYYQNNLTSLIHVLQVMEEFGLYKIIFSSSATVYAPAVGDDALDEKSAKGPTNPYGQTKLMGEEICCDVASAWSAKSENVGIISLRYGNPVNSLPSLPERPVGPAMNLFNVITDVIQGRRDKVSVFGTDYPTRDGTGIRDYVHVMDLAEAHVAAVKCVMRPEETTEDIYQAVNIGTGQGWSVLEMIRAMEKVHGCHIPYTFASRRPGDVASSVFDVQAAKNGRLKWSAKRCSIEELCCASK